MVFNIAVNTAEDESLLRSLTELLLHHHPAGAFQSIKEVRIRLFAFSIMSELDEEVQNNLATNPTKTVLHWSPLDKGTSHSNEKVMDSTTV